MGEKKVNGRKRHILTDTLGNLIRALVTAANVSDPDGAEELLARGAQAAPKLALVWADSHYSGDLQRWAEEELNIRIEVVKRAEGQQGFAVIPRRWAVERTFAWLGRCRRLSKDYEHAEEYAESWLYLAAIQRLLRRLAPDPEAAKPYEQPITSHSNQSLSDAPIAA
jgi:putative transposase